VWLLSLAALLLLQTAPHSSASEQAPPSIIGGIPFRLSLHGPGVTAVFEGEQGRPTPFTARRYVRASPIEKSIRSLTFFFEGDSGGYPLALEKDQSSPNSYWPLNVFAVKGFVILPQQNEDQRLLVGIGHLREYLLGQRTDADKMIEHLKDYLLRGDTPNNIETVPYTLELYSAEATAVFRGSVTGGFPLQFGTEMLSFTFPSSLDEFEFRPKGAVYHSDWEFDVISPDGRHVLLMQSHYGPYHIISVDRLRGYLVGDLAPNYEIDWKFPNSSAAAVLSNGGWWSTHLVVFNATCCGTTERLVYELGNSAGPVRYSVDN
jgi:hypothetical protein